MSTSEIFFRGYFMRKSKSHIIQRLLDEKPWSSSSEYFIRIHVLIWILLLLFTLWIGTFSNGGLNEEPLYIDPIPLNDAERIVVTPLTFTLVGVESV